MQAPLFVVACVAIKFIASGKDRLVEVFTLKSGVWHKGFLISYLVLPANRELCVLLSCN